MNPGDPVLDLFDFVSKEDKNFLITMANNMDEFNLVSHVQDLFARALSLTEADEDDFAVFQFLIFAHYHFLYATACFMRSHLNEAMSSVRAATDAALSAAIIIKDRSKQVEYLNRQPPFDKLIRHYKNMPDKGAEIHEFIPHLIDLNQKCSMLSHADIGSFAHRVGFRKTEERTVFEVQYFQFADNKPQLKIHFLNVLHSFVLVLDIFSDFLIVEQKLVTTDWQRDLLRLGKHMADRVEILKKQMPPDDDLG